MTTTMEKRPFASWGGKEIDDDNSKFTGILTYRRDNGSRLCEREMYKGSTWGCSRYYDTKDQYVGQEWYGKPGYNEKSLAYASKSVAVHEAWVDHAQYQRIYNETTANYQDNKRPKIKYEFKSTDGEWAGVEISMGPNGKPLVETELMAGFAFGCRRYYNEQGRLVGQELYGGVDWACKNGGRHITPVDTSAKAMRSLPPAAAEAPFLTRFTTQKAFEAIKAEFRHALAGMVVEVKEAPTASPAQQVLQVPAARKPAAAVAQKTNGPSSEASLEESVSTLDSTRSDHNNNHATTTKDNEQMALLAKQIAELMARQDNQEEKLQQEQRQRQLVEEQLQKERQERAELQRKLQHVDEYVVALKEELNQAEQHKQKAVMAASEQEKQRRQQQQSDKAEEEFNSQLQLWEQLQVQQKLIQEQQDLLQESQKQQLDQQTAINNLRAQLEEERQQRQIQQTEINQLREELEKMKDVTATGQVQQKTEMTQPLEEPEATTAGQDVEEPQGLAVQKNEPETAKENNDEGETAEAIAAPAVDTNNSCIPTDEGAEKATSSETDNKEGTENEVTENEESAPGDIENEEPHRVDTSPTTDPNDAVEKVRSDVENVLVTSPNERITTQDSDEASTYAEETNATDFNKEKEDAAEVQSEDVVQATSAGKDTAPEGFEHASFPVVDEEAANTTNDTGKPIIDEAAPDPPSESEPHLDDLVEDVENEPEVETQVEEEEEEEETQEDGKCECDPSKRHHGIRGGLIVEDPKPRPRRQRSNKMKFSWRRPGASFKLSRSRSKEGISVSPPVSAAASVATSNDDANIDDNASLGPPEVMTSSNHTNDEQQPQPENDSTPESPMEPEAAPEDSVTSVTNTANVAVKEVAEELDEVEAGELLQASVSSMNMDQLDDGETPQCDDEPGSGAVVEDPVPRRTKEKKGIFKWNPHASFKALVH